ncbi:MoxR family ATPase [Kitasatospora sp. CB02891]|uniref:AAA family ATPase n=1 Tax=Kitasatospora sp. CB02891 TaxID=2020329 RepID=UPI000C27B42B|nr:MoxR family ATPase [Kitasatospora sp. CB02891]PJN29356.1 ATPase [Kitasatospora sp. CB02891]
MSWNSYYRGDGEPRDVTLAPPPPWRRLGAHQPYRAFLPPEGLTDAVNASLYLHRPLLITGSAGTGKSTVIEQVAAELRLGPVLKWHITSRSTLPDALCRYDALGHIHALRIGEATERDAAPIESFLKLGPLGTALLPSERPRALLIDEIDKSDIDLPADLLDVLETGTFEIPELVRQPAGRLAVSTWVSTDTAEIEDGRVQCTTFPFIVMTSNGERDFPAPFLRRCIRYDMPRPTADTLRRAVQGHLGLGGTPLPPDADELITRFAGRVARGDQLAIDQLLNAVRLVTDADAPTGERRSRLLDLMLRDLSGA